MIDTSNAYIFNGNLCLKAEYSSTTWSCTQGQPAITTNHNYRCGVVQSKFQYKYGYFEISAKLPQGKGYWPAFWLWGGAYCDYHTEIDIMERFGVTDYRFSSHYHWTTFNNCNETRISYGEETAGLPDLSVYRKYAVEWSPGRMIFYFENEPIKTFHVASNPHNRLMGVLLNIAIHAGNQPDVNTVFPAYYDIDYLKIYQLKTACSTVESICTFNPSTYNYALKKSISIAGGGACISNINTSSNVALRATDYILLDEGTTITANGSGYFLADVIPCTD